MATSPAPPVDPAALDAAGISMLTAPRNPDNPRSGAIYDPGTWAAAAPVWFHPMVDGRFLMIARRRWYAATPDPANLGAYTSYTEDSSPGWMIFDPTGQRAIVPNAPVLIPLSTKVDSAEVVAAASRPPNYLYLLHAVMIAGNPGAVLQHFHLNPSGAVTLAGEELLPVGVRGTTVSYGAPVSAYGVTPVSASGSGSYALGNQFTLLTPGQITALRFYRDATDTTTNRTARLYKPDGTLVATSASSGAESGTGWFDLPLATPIAFAANDAFVVAIDHPGVYWYNAGTTTDNPNIVWDESYYTATLGGFPNAVGGGGNYGVDLLVEFSSTTIDAVVFNRGIQYDTPYLVVYGTDPAGAVYRIRKSWGRVGHNKQMLATSQVHDLLPGTSVAWEYSTPTGYSTDPSELAPVGGLTTVGPMSFASWRYQRIATTVSLVGGSYTGQFWSSSSGRPFVALGLPVSLGTVASWLGGGIQLQPQLLATVPAGSTAAFPYVVSAKATVPTNTLNNRWSLLTLP